MSPSADRLTEDPLVVDSGGLTLCREAIAGLVTFGFSLAAYALVFALVQAFYHPDLAQALAQAKSVAANAGGCLPEPKERLLFVAAMVSFPACSLFFYWAASLLLRGLNPRLTGPLYGLLLGASLAAAGYVAAKGLAADNPFAAVPQNAHDMACATNAAFYFKSTFVGDHFWLYTAALFPLVVLGFLFAQKMSADMRRRLNWVGAIGVSIFCSLIIVAVFLIASFPFPYTYENKYDFNAVFYSVVQVCQGVPMLVDHFTNTYGLYPHFIAPVLTAAGGPSIANFTALMALLLCLCFLLLLLFFFGVIRSRALILFGFTSVFFNCYAFGKIAESYDAYFAMHPIRWLFPMLLLFYSQLYLKRPSRPAYVLSLFLFAAGILWNPDFGMAAFLALLAFYAFLELGARRTPLGLVLRVAFHGLSGAGAVALTLLLYAVAMRVFYGAFPDLGEMFSTLKIFSVIGFNMLPLPAAWHPWMLVFATYVLGLLVSARAVVRGEVTPRSATVFLLSVLGMALFAYYQGRSHNGNLFICSPMAFVLLTVFADDLLALQHRLRTLFIPFSALLFVLAFPLFQTLYDYPRLSDLFLERKSESENKDEEEYLRQNAAFIKASCNPRERVLIFTAPHYPALYHCLSDTAAAVNPGLMDLMLKTDYARLLDFLRENESTKIFFEPGSFVGADNEIPMTLASLYEVKDVSPQQAMARLGKRRAEKAGSLFFKHQEPSCLHTSLDTAGERLAYARGQKGPIDPGSQFTVEVLFKPAELPPGPVTAWATVFSNVDGSSNGMVFQQVESKNNNYVFGLAKTGLQVPVVPAVWNYVALRVDGASVSLYANGLCLGTRSAGRACRPSAEPLFIGTNRNRSGNFFGEIREIQVSRTLVSDAEIKANWARIENELLNRP